jgi:hypothetical protein
MKRVFGETADPYEHERDEHEAKSAAAEPVCPIQLGELPTKHTTPKDFRAIWLERSSRLSVLPKDLAESYLARRYLDPCQFASAERLTYTETVIPCPYDRILATCPSSGESGVLHQWPEFYVKSHIASSTSGKLEVLFMAVHTSTSPDYTWISMHDAQGERLWGARVNWVPIFHSPNGTHAIQCISANASEPFQFAIIHPSEYKQGSDLLFNVVTFVANDASISSEVTLELLDWKYMLCEGGLLAMPECLDVRPSYISPAHGRIHLPAYGWRILMPEADSSMSACKFHQAHIIVGNTLVNFLQVNRRPFLDDERTELLLAFSNSGSYFIVSRRHPFTPDNRRQAIHSLLVRPRGWKRGDPPAITITPVPNTLHIAAANDSGFIYVEKLSMGANGRLTSITFDKPLCLGN